MELHDNPQAVAAAERIKAERGFDPLDPEVVSAAVERYKNLKFRMWLWTLLFTLPSLLIIIGMVIAVDPMGQGAAVPIGIVIALIGVGLAWWPFRRYLRLFREWRRQVIPVIAAYEAVLRAGQPDPRHSGHAVIQWKRAQGLM